VNTVKPGMFEFYFRLNNAYSIRHLVTEVKYNPTRLASQEPAIVRDTVAKLVLLLTCRRRASLIAL